MVKVAILFGGQGNPFLGTNNAFVSEPKVQRVLEKVDHDCHYQYSIRSLMIHGPRTAFERPIYSQPAIFALEMALLNVLRVRYAAHWDILPKERIFLGEGLGEYSALVGAGILTLTVALNLVKERGRLLAKYPDETKEVISGMRVVFQELRNDQIRPPKFPWFSVTEQRLIDSGDEAIKAMQSYKAPPTIRETLATLMDRGVDCFIEIGISETLSPVIREVRSSAPTFFLGPETNFMYELNRLYALVKETSNQ